MRKIESPLQLELVIHKIDDFSPYLNHPNNKYRIVMAQYGKEIDKLLKYNYTFSSEFDDVKIALIQSGFAEEHWCDWKNDGQLVREALVRKGYDVGYFLNDDSESVRFTICAHHPEYIPQLITQSPGDYNNAFISLQDSVDKSLLELIIKHYDHQHTDINPIYEYESYKIVYDSMVKEPTTMEQTMTRKQLFIMGNPLWAQGLTKRAVSGIRFYHEEAKDLHKEDKFLEKIDTLNPEKDRNKIHSIFYNL